MQINLSNEAVQLLRGILLNHKDYLLQNAEGEPWQNSELELTDQLIETFSQN
jgi:hypothetical protein